MKVDLRQTIGLCSETGSGRFTLICGAYKSARRPQSPSTILLTDGRDTRIVTECPEAHEGNQHGRSGGGIRDKRHDGDD